MYVDVHNHFLPEPYIDRLLKMDTAVGLTRSGDQLYAVHERSGTASVKAGNRIPLNDGFTDVQERLEWMEDHDIDRTVVSVSTPNPLAGAFTPEQSTDLVTAINDGFATVRDQYPDVFAGLGMLPLREPDIAVNEVDRIATDLNLSGIALPTSLPEGKLSDDSLTPVFEAIDEHDLTVFFHPHGNPLSDVLDSDESFLSPLVVFPTETTFQIARLIYDGFFDAYDFDTVLPHMGGTLLHLAGRIDRGRQEIDDPNAPPARSVLETLKGCYFDTISFHQPAMRAAIETVGVDQFVFGTDYAFDEEDTDTIVADLEAVVPDEADRQKIATETARDLFDL
ncbi:amidohydrolase family protein [Saliphagus sp. LR7]|uniref:amidohydrolase family protein n=1 Tax=Saliphagus sp. LR7 TaxID=2282654 RepID=UPI000DF74E61|nr:amidohydrolase family protein [Saliphagus sp. LR7]